MCDNRCRQGGLGACPHEFPHKKCLSVGTFGKGEQPGVLEGTPEEEDGGFLCEKSLHRAGKYDKFIILYKKKIFTITLKKSRCQAQ